MSERDTADLDEDALVGEDIKAVAANLERSLPPVPP